MEANLLLGDIVKVTPSSKVVGDMAIFMVQNGLDMDNIYEKGRDLAYPNSVVDYFKGMIGQPEGGFDPKLQEIVLKGIEPITVRPGTLLPDEDFEAIKEEYREEFGIELAEREVTSAALYPKVFKNYVKFYQDYGDFMRMDTHAFFYGLKEGETAEVEVDKGKRFIIRMVKMAQPNEEGYRPVLFEVDGFRREIYIEDKRSLFSKEKSTMLKADKNNPKEIGSGIPGTVLKVLVNEGDEVAENQPLIIVEAMKMETEIVAHAAGKIKEIYVSEGQSVQSGELIITME